MTNGPGSSEAHHPRSLLEAGALIPCEELPELQGLPDLPPVYGNCRWVAGRVGGRAGGPLAHVGKGGREQQAAREAGDHQQNSRRPSNHLHRRASLESGVHANSIITGAAAAAGDGGGGGAHPERWIALWRDGDDGSASGVACAEGAPGPAGRYNASCVHVYTSALRGISADFSRPQLAAFLRAYGPRLGSLHRDAPVRLATIQESLRSAGDVSDASERSRWGLDRLDQAGLPLDGLFSYFNNGTGVNVYVMDTVSARGRLEGWWGCGDAGVRQGRGAM